jgi:hypothetical protein
MNVRIPNRIMQFGYGDRGRPGRERLDFFACEIFEGLESRQLYGVPATERSTVQ